MADALGTFGAGPVGVVTAQEHRLALAATIAGLSTGILDARTGVLPCPNSLALVTGTAATAPMTVSIAAHQAVTARTSAQGVYLGPTLEAPTTVNIAAAPSSNSRIDVVYVVQQDADSSVLSPDASTGPVWAVATGTASSSPVKPAIPVGALELATVTVAAGATTTAGGLVTISNTVRQTVARGGIVPSRPGVTAAGGYVGAYRDDPTSFLQRWDGTNWNTYATTASVAATTAFVTQASGWSTYSGYYAPACRVSSDGVVTMRGASQRTGSNLVLPISSTPITVGTIPAAATPTQNASAPVVVGLGSGQDQYPAKVFIPANSTNLQIVGLSSGAGTFFTNIGFIDFGGASWYVR